MATLMQIKPRKFPNARRKHPTRSKTRKSDPCLHGKRMAGQQRFRAAVARPRGAISFPHDACAPRCVRHCDLLSPAVSVVWAAPLRVCGPVTLLHQKRCREPVLPQQSALHFRAAEILPIGEMP